ncbi:MAG: fumarylacetoacetate hydrolase family protein [Pseudomonadota bacterium]
MTPNTAQEAAQALYDDHVAGSAYRPLEGDHKPKNIADAYQIQDAFIALRLADGLTRGGFKLAYTTETMQQRSGLTEPALGHIFAHTIYQSPAALRCADHIKLGMECELAVRIDRPIPNGVVHTRGSVAQCVGAVMAAIEVIDSRAPEAISDADRALLGVAGNIWNAGIVLGPAVENWQDIDLESVRGAVHVNRELAGEGFGRDVMGHPLEPLAWLANALDRRGESIPVGSVVITGSLVAPQFLSEGDEVVVSVDSLGDAVMNVS